jgi:hypothetical protein
MLAPRFRFTTGQLFYVASLLAVSLALCSANGLRLAGFFVAVFATLVWWQVLAGAKRELLQRAHRRHREMAIFANRQVRRSRWERLSKCWRMLGLVTPAEWLATIVIIGITVGLLLPSANSETSVRSTVRNMMSIARALKEYEQVHGQLAPPVSYSADGRAMHSWRVLILPYLGEHELYARYRLDEPWDSEHNLQLADECPPCFEVSHHSPLQLSGADAFIYAVSDDGRTWSHVGAEKGSVFVAEHERFSARWTEPTFLTMEELQQFSKRPALSEGFWERGFFSSRHLGRLAATEEVAIAIKPLTYPYLYDNLIRAIKQSHNEAASSYYVVHITNIFRLVCFVLVVIYPIRWLHQLRSMYS